LRWAPQRIETQPYLRIVRELFEIQAQLDELGDADSGAAPTRSRIRGWRYSGLLLILFAVVMCPPNQVDPSADKAISESVFRVDLGRSNLEP
jgi:hypothetical protein